MSAFNMPENQENNHYIIETVAPNNVFRAINSFPSTPKYWEISFVADGLMFFLPTENKVIQPLPDTAQVSMRSLIQGGRINHMRFGAGYFPISPEGFAC